MKHQWIEEPVRRVPVTAACDVAVVGGGIAGVAAAVAAARNGAAVLLIEKQCALGGLATLGNVVIYLPLCDGHGHQVIKGLGEELLKLSVRDDPDRIPACWRAGGTPDDRSRTRYRVQFNPAALLLALEELLLAEGVDILYDTRFCDVHKRRSRIQAVLVENKDGRSAIETKMVVDASGDADVCFRAGEPTVSLATNAASAWYFRQAGAEVQLRPLHVPFDPSGETVPGNARGAGPANGRQPPRGAGCRSAPAAFAPPEGSHQKADRPAGHRHAEKPRIVPGFVTWQADRGKSCHHDRLALH